MSDRPSSETERTDPPPANRAAGELFATTRWTMVLTAGKGTAISAARALEELCGIYWYPLYAFARRHGRSPEDAEDLTQGFFARLLARHDLQNLSPDRGRFRAFLLASFKHFMANEYDRAVRQKRGGGAPALPLDGGNAETRYRVEPADELSPDKLFDRAWAVLLLERVILRLNDESVAQGKAQLFDRLKPCLSAGKGAIDYAQAGTDLGLAEGAVRVAVHRLRRRYRELLREEIAQTLSDPAQVEEELRALFNAFAK